MMGSGAERIHEKIRSFKRKYYLDIFIRGLILSLAILIAYFLTAAVLEYNLWLGGWARFVTLVTFFVVAGFCIVKFLREPLQWWIAHRGLTEEQSARLIGQFIPTVKDRLVNFVQLESTQNNSLAAASLLQKTRDFEPLSFESVIDLKQNRKYLKYLVAPILVATAILLFNQSILTASTERIIFFNREYSPEAPFKFILANKQLKAFFNEDFTLDVSLEGNSIPENVYIISRNQRFKMNRVESGSYSYTFEKLQHAMDFQLEAAGFFSDGYRVDLHNRPELSQLKLELEYPRYLQRNNEQLINAGNLEIPEGTRVTWRLKTLFTGQARILFGSDSVDKDAELSDQQVFNYSKVFTSPDWYEVILENEHSKNKDRISYSVEVIKDQHPSIAVNNLKDTVLFKRVLLGGAVGDDHGVSALRLHYRIRNADGNEKSARSVAIPIGRNQLQQNFFFDWNVDSLVLGPGDQLEYYLQVWDNDGVNGRKSTKSSTYAFIIPGEDVIMVDIRNSQSKGEEKIEQSVGKAQKLQDQIEQASQKLKGKQTLDWQDKKMLEDIVQQKQNLDQLMEELKKDNKLLEEKKENFTEQNERIREKAQQIQKLMDELLDEETRKLFEELQKLLREKSDLNNIQKILDKLNQNTNNLEKELERTLELFKDLKFDFKFDQALKSLERDIEKQEELLKQTEQLEKSGKNDDKKKGSESRPEESPQTPAELAEQQEEITDDVKQNREELKELQKLGEELHRDEELPNEEDMNEVIENQEQSKEMLDQNKPGDSKSKQQKSLQKMKQMQQQMEGAQNSMSMEIDMENIESLRQILHGLVKLSYDQENLLKNFAELTPNDPKFNSLAQRQLKLKDDVKVLEDSLLALGKKDPFMGSVVTKEVGELKTHLDNAIEANRERRGKPQSSTEMQAAMTSINNLALMLDDHFEMLMQMMAKAKPKMGKGKGDKKGEKPNLGQMQQKLNQRIQELKNSGKGGKELSEELAELAAEQERIRKALQQMQEKMKEGGNGSPGDQIPGKMEQTEMDLVNKQITDQLIRRQQEILTRLLETEKSMREQDMDEERKGETAKEYEKEIPKAFEEYLRLKEKEVELLKTVPPRLYPYYKKEVSEYFKRMGK